MYKIEFSPQGAKSFESVDKDVGQRMLDKLKWLVQNIDRINPLPLRSDLAGLYKLRVGDWRIIYEINYDEQIITVHKVGHRRDIYR